MSIEIVWPQPSPNATQATLAARPRSLAGLRVGFLDNTKIHLDAFFGAIEEWLTQAGVSEMKLVRKTSVAGPMSMDDEAVLRNYDLVLTAIGD